MATWQIDKSHSTVEFVVKHMMISKTKGRFADFEGTVEFDESNIGNAAVSVAIDVASIDTHDAKRDEHLRSADFLDAETFPQITFTSTEVRSRGGDKFEIVGDLTIRDITRQVVLNAASIGLNTSPWGQQVAAFEASTEINRKDFGLTWNVALETGGFLVGDTVKINLGVEAVKQETAVSEAA